MKKNKCFNFIKNYIGMQLILFFSLQITSSTVVCSNHFKADDHKGWNPVRKRLNPTAVPTIFEWKADQVPRSVLENKTTNSVNF